MKKRVLSLFLTLALCLGLSAPAFADLVPEEQWKANYGGAYTSGNWTYDLKEDGTAILCLSTITSDMAVNGTLTLPATLDGHAVTEVGDSALNGNSPLHQLFAYQHLVIPEGYTKLGMAAFQSSTLTSADFPSTLVDFDSNTFIGSNLTSVTVRSSTLEIDKLGEYITLTAVTCPAGSKAEIYALANHIPVTYLDKTAPATPAVTSGFTDVPADAWYAAPVAWAVEQGITSGTSETTFSPDRDCTRAEIITFLWRAAGSPEPGALSTFSDVKADAYYARAAAWAKESGAVSGDSFAPDAPCTRLMAVEFMWKQAGSPGAAGAAFTDISSDAVNWAVEQSVTSGTSETTFSPDTVCTRAQIVTFLCRAFAE